MSTQNYLSRYYRQKSLRLAGYRCLNMDGHSISRNPAGGWWLAESKDPLWTAAKEPIGGVQGYYCNIHQDCYIPAVVRLGKVLLAGYREPWNDGFAAGPDTFPVSEMDSAKRAADRYTEIVAERAMESSEREDERYMLESRIRDRTEERETAYSNVRQMVAAMRESRLTEWLCAKLREDIRGTWERARECTREIVRLNAELVDFDGCAK